MNSLKPLNTNKISSLKLNNYVKVSIEHDYPTFYVSIPQLNANGCGYTLNGALADLKESIIGAYEIYIKDRKEEELSVKSMELRNRLLSLISEESYENALTEMKGSKFYDSKEAKK